MARIEAPSASEWRFCSSVFLVALLCALLFASAAVRVKPAGHFGSIGGAPAATGSPAGPTTVRDQMNGTLPTTPPKDAPVVDETRAAGREPAVTTSESSSGRRTVGDEDEGGSHRNSNTSSSQSVDESPPTNQTETTLEDGAHTEAPSVAGAGGGSNTSSDGGAAAANDGEGVGFVWKPRRRRSKGKKGKPVGWLPPAVQLPDLFQLNVSVVTPPSFEEALDDGSFAALAPTPVAVAEGATLGATVDEHTTAAFVNASRTAVTWETNDMSQESTKAVATAVAGPPEGEEDDARRCAEVQKERDGVPVLVVLVGTPEGRTLENAIRKVIRPLCAWSVLIATQCTATGQPVGMMPTADAEAAPWKQTLPERESAGSWDANTTARLGSDLWLAGDDLLECSQPGAPHAPLPLQFFGWTLKHVCSSGAATDLAALVRASAAVVQQSAQSRPVVHVVNVTGAATFDVAVVPEGGSSVVSFPDDPLGNNSQAMDFYDPAGGTVIESDMRTVYSHPEPLEDGEELLDGESSGTVTHELADAQWKRRRHSAVNPSSATVLRRNCERWRHCYGDNRDACRRRARRLVELLDYIAVQDAFAESHAARMASSDPFIASTTPSARPETCDAVSGQMDAARREGRRPVAVIVTGTIRVLEHTLKASLEQLKAAATARGGAEFFLFAHFAVQRSPSEFEADALKYIASLPELKALVVRDINVLSVLATDPFDFPDFPYKHKCPGCGRGIVHVGNLGSQDYGTWGGYTLSRLYEARCGVRFDLTMRLRSDVVFLAPPTTKARTPTSEFIMVDGYGDFGGGMNDQFFYGPTWLSAVFYERYFTLPVSFRRFHYASTEVSLRQALIERFIPFGRILRTKRKEVLVVKRLNPPPPFLMNASVVGEAVVRLLFGTVAPS